MKECTVSETKSFSGDSPMCLFLKCFRRRYTATFVASVLSVASLVTPAARALAAPDKAGADQESVGALGDVGLDYLPQPAAQLRDVHGAEPEVLGVVVEVPAAERRHLPDDLLAQHLSDDLPLDPLV